MQARAVQTADFGRLVHQHDAPPDAINHAPDLKSVLSTAELNRRPSRSPDHTAENRALTALMQELATSPHTILQKLADTALSLCHAHSAGLSLLEDGDQQRRFHWRAIAGQWSPHVNGGTPRDFGPCGAVLDRNVAMICSRRGFGTRVMDGMIQRPFEWRGPLRLARGRARV